MKKIDKLEKEVRTGDYDTSDISWNPNSDGLISDEIMARAAVTMGYIVRMAEIKVRLRALSGEAYENAMNRLDRIDDIYRQRNRRITA